MTISSLSEVARRSWARHRRVVFATAAAVVGLLIGVGAWSFLLPGARQAAPGVVELPAPTAPPTEVEPVVVIPDAPQVGVATTSDVSPFAGIANPPPQPPKRTGLTAYVVQSGDVLWQISEQYHLRPETILWANDIDNADLILVGQKLVIPPVDGVLYTVRPGDRLADVATRYGVDLSAVAEANALADPNQVQAGQDIFLPGGRPLGPAPSDASAQADSADRETAGPPIPLPDNIDQLLAAGWLQTQGTTTLYKTADRGAKPLHDLPASQRLERLDGFQNGRLEVRDPGDGSTRQAMTGWVDAAAVGLGRAPSSRELPLSYPADTAMDIAQIFAPYRSQLDGSSYQEANCGPTTIGMALAAFGVDVPPRQLRAEALNAQHLFGNNVGTLITALANVVEQHGLTPLDLYDPDGGIHRWTVDEIRDHVAQGRPVVVQTRYRSLPGRGGTFYYGDHYIMVTGIVPSGLLYNDPIDFDGLGWDRVISADRLAAAMDVADRRYVHSAFAVGR